MRMTSERLRRLVKSYCGLFLLSQVLVACGDSQEDVTGTVYDMTSNKPLKGVYLLATYDIGSTVMFAHSSSSCIETRGMYTGSDGRFTFPVLNSVRPLIRAVAVDYVHVRSGFTIKQRFYGNEKQTNDDKFMIHRRLSDRRSAVVGCERPRTREALAPNITYLEIMQESDDKYGNLGSAAAISNLIESLQSNLPSSNRLER